MNVFQLVHRGGARRALCMAALIAAGSQPLLAQDERADDPARSQALFFERALQGAIEQGGQQLAKRALLLVPELTLSTEEATIRSVRLTGYGFFFDVQVPDIQSTVLLYDMMTAQRERPQGPAQPVATTGGGSAPVFDPSREYSAYVRDAVIDAVLSTSGVLTLGSEEHLTVAISGIDRPQPNPLYRSNQAKLVLTVKGADLDAFRQGRITRDEAVERILEERF